MPDYRKMVEELFLAPARGWVAQSPEAPMQRLKNEGGLLGELAYSLDPVSAFGGYGGLAAMAFPPGSPKWNPQTLYRGAPNKNLVKDYIGSRNTSVGNWFTNDPSVAMEYAPSSFGKPDQTKVFKANIRGDGKELNLAGDYPTSGGPELKALQKAFRGMKKEWGLTDFNEFVDSIYSGRLWDHTGDASLRYQNRVMRELADQGFDVVRIRDETFGKPNTSTVVFDPDAVKFLDE